MEIAPGSEISRFAGQLPLLIVYIVGLVIAFRRRHEQPRAARLAIIAFCLLLVDLVILSRFSLWLLGYLIAQGATESGIMQGMTLAGVAGSLVQAVAIWLLLRAVFPARPGAVRPSWWVRLVGALIGLLVGLGAAMLLGDAIGAMLNISNFEGGRGYFVVMCLIPVFMIVGAAAGALAAPWVRPRSNAPAPPP